ncbi:MAG: pilus assembly protein TadG-related protein [Actinomycetota bacterium]
MMSRARLNDERGATIVIVGLMLVAILGMVALVTDVGGLVTMKRRVVTASDSAALAAAQSFARNQGGLCGSAGGNATALNAANSFAQDNVSTAASVAFTPDCHNKSVEVRYEAPVHFFFAQVIGAGSGDQVPSTSTAIWGPIGRAKPVPIMVFESQLQACGIPDTVPPDGESIPCDLTFNANSGDGAPYWGELDFNHWNDPTHQKCSLSAAELKAVVDAGGWHDYLDLNSNGVTPACGDNGRSTSVFDQAQGQVLTFPVVADTPLYDGGPSGGILVNVLGFVKVTVLSLDNGSTITLHTEWAGPTSQPGVPVVGGSDFGERAVRLVG